MTNPAQAVEDAAARLSNEMGTFPRQFGNYLLLQMLARGGMGEVYLAKQGGIAGIEKNCVVKTLRGHFTVDREYVTRFMDEARVVVHLTHRNICQVYDVGKVGSKYYLAMEHIVGRDLRSLLQDPRVHGQFTPAMLLHIICETLEALDYAHRLKDPATGELLNVVHRDVSPQNIMLNFEGEVKLIDFGLAASSKKVEKTQPNVVMGKMAYMAPEQARGDPVDGRADLFAVAVLAYEMLVGERFYEGMSFEEMWGVAGRGGFRPRNWERLNPQIRTILDRGLATDLELRFQTCGDFKEALSNYLFQNQMRASARSLRAIMEGALASDLQEVRDLLTRYSNVRMGPGGEIVAPDKGHSALDDQTQTGTAPLSAAAASQLPTEFEGDAASSDELGAFQALPSTESTSQSVETKTHNQLPASTPSEHTMILRDVGLNPLDERSAALRPARSKLLPAVLGIIAVLLLVIAGLVVFNPGGERGTTVAAASPSTKLPVQDSPSEKATGAGTAMLDNTGEGGGALSGAPKTAGEVANATDPPQAAPAEKQKKPAAVRPSGPTPKVERSSERRRARRRSARRSRRAAVAATAPKTAPEPPKAVTPKPSPPPPAPPKQPTSFPTGRSLKKQFEFAVTRCLPFGTMCQGLKKAHPKYKAPGYFKGLDGAELRRVTSWVDLCRRQCVAK